VAEGARSAIRILTRAVRKYLEPGYLVAMVRYWSRLGVGSYAAFEAARDRAAATSSRPAAQVPAQRDPGQHPAERKAPPADRRPKMYFACPGSPSSSVLVPRT
jgi:hypothetical protein